MRSGIVMSVRELEVTERYVVREMCLEPGALSEWHIDPCRRYTVVLAGDRLAIEFAGVTERHEFPVHRGLAGWDEPEGRVHRAINTGTQPYVEVVTFLRAVPGNEVQPLMGRSAPGNP
jgi:oxalate decarboxylase/phosphoglucose isomerase-like protein (cupin superfamily)